MVLLNVCSNWMELDVKLMRIWLKLLILRSIKLRPRKDRNILTLILARFMKELSIARPWRLVCRKIFKFYSKIAPTPSNNSPESILYSSTLKLARTSKKCFKK